MYFICSLLLTPGLNSTKNFEQYASQSKFINTEIMKILIEIILPVLLKVQYGQFLLYKIVILKKNKK